MTKLTVISEKWGGEFKGWPFRHCGMKPVIHLIILQNYMTPLGWAEKGQAQQP